MPQFQFEAQAELLFPGGVAAGRVPPDFEKGLIACAGQYLLLPARVLDLIPAYPRDVQNNEDVDAEDDPMQLIGTTDYLINLEWQIDTAGDDGQPFRPDPLPPQAIAFDKAQRGVHYRDADDHCNVGARHLAGGVEKLLRPAVMRVDVQVKEHMFGSLGEVHIAADHPDEDIGPQQGQPAFQCLPKGHGAQAGPVRPVLGRRMIVSSGSSAHR